MKAQLFTPLNLNYKLVRTQSLLKERAIIHAYKSQLAYIGKCYFISVPDGTFKVFICITFSTSLSSFLKL